MKRLVFLCLALALLAAGCSLPSDEEPRVLPLDEIPQDLWPGQLPTATPEILQTTGNLGNRQIHMISAGNRLETVEREIAETPQELLRILLNGTGPAEAERGITSAFNSRTSGLKIADVSELFQLITVEVEPGSLDSRRGNSEQKLGFAQIVFTLTSLDQIENVTFIEPNPDNPEVPRSLAVQTDNGSTLPGDSVSRADFALLDPNLGPEPGFDIPIPEPTVEVVDLSLVSPISVWEIREIFRDSSGAEVLAPPDGVENADITLDQQLVGVVRLVEPNADAALASLLSGVQATDRSPGLRTALPPDAFVNSLTVSQFNVGGASVDVATIAQVDFAAGSLPSATDGDERLLAAAQVVFTLTGLPEIDGVVFALDGAPIGMPTDNGLSAPFDPASPRGLTRADYALQARGSFVAPPAPEPTSPPAIEGPLPPSDGAESNAADETAPTPTPGG